MENLKFNLAANSETRGEASRGGFRSRGSEAKVWIYACFEQQMDRAATPGGTNGRVLPDCYRSQLFAGLSWLDRNSRSSRTAAASAALRSSAIGKLWTVDCVNLPQPPRTPPSPAWNANRWRGSRIQPLREILRCCVLGVFGESCGLCRAHACQRAGRITPLLVKTCQRPFSYLISSMRPRFGTSWPSTASITPGCPSRMATPS